MLLVTGAAGFIGYHLSLNRLQAGEEVVGIDNLNDYYDVKLKRDRLGKLKQFPNFHFTEMNIADRIEVPKLFKQYPIKRVVNLAAQAGVRYSLTNPYAYIESNVMGFTNIIEACRHHKVEHLVYASSSSVYGANGLQPFSESQAVDHPLSIYAATKKCNELIAHSYANLYDLPSTGLRFFTVYGPWGRPDMALFLFAKAITNAEPIKVFNEGEMVRDFTYVDDIVAGIVRAIDRPAEPNPNWDAMQPDPASSFAPFKVYNIGNNQPMKLLDYIHALESALGKKAQLNLMPMQAGDVPSTHADVTRVSSDLGYTPKVSVEDGIQAFVDWYQSYYCFSSVN